MSYSIAANMSIFVKHENSNRDRALTPTTTDTCVKGRTKQRYLFHTTVSLSWYSNKNRITVLTPVYASRFKGFVQVLRFALRYPSRIYLVPPKELNFFLVISFYVFSVFPLVYHMYNFSVSYACTRVCICICTYVWACVCVCARVYACSYIYTFCFIFIFNLNCLNESSFLTFFFFFLFFFSFFASHPLVFFSFH